jgi:hypothetical protein
MDWPLDHATSQQDTRKSNAALLLPLFVPLSPLLRYSYKKMGGVPHPLRKDDARNAGFSLCGVSQNGTHIVKLACRLGRPVLLKPITHLLEVPRGCTAYAERVGAAVPQSLDTPAAKTTAHPGDIDDTNHQCFLSLTGFPRAYAQKDPNVFYHLQAHTHLTTSVFYHLRKRRRGVKA